LITTTNLEDCFMGSVRLSKKLMKRFCKDYNLPINVFTDEMFEYYSELYDFFPKEKWDKLCEKVENEYGGNVELWLDYCAKVRDAAIYGVIETEAYKRFNSEDMSKWALDANVPRVGEHSVFTKENVGKIFISIDLKKANFQALRWAEVIDDDSYEDFVARFGGDDYIAGSKYLRQVIFGKMNPSRTVTVEKYMMGIVYSVVHDYIEGMGYRFYSMNSDELVFINEGIGGSNTYEDDMVAIVERVYEYGIDVRCECFILGRLPIVNSNGNDIDAYIRYNIHTKEETLKKVSTTFYPQVYKIWKGQPIDEKDKVFFFEDQLAYFVEPLKLDYGN